MTADERARALLETLTRRPNGFHDALQVSEADAIERILAYGREERARALKDVIAEAQRRANRADAQVEGCDGDEFRWLNQICAELHDFASWCRQQASEEETP